MYAVALFRDDNATPDDRREAESMAKLGDHDDSDRCLDQWQRRYHRGDTNALPGPKTAENLVVSLWRTQAGQNPMMGVLRNTRLPPIDHPSHEDSKRGQAWYKYHGSDL